MSKVHQKNKKAIKQETTHADELPNPAAAEPQGFKVEEHKWLKALLPYITDIVEAELADDKETSDKIASYLPLISASLAKPIFTPVSAAALAVKPKLDSIDPARITPQHSWELELAELRKKSLSEQLKVVIQHTNSEQNGRAQEEIARPASPQAAELTPPAAASSSPLSPTNFERAGSYAERASPLRNRRGREEAGEEKGRNVVGKTEPGQGPRGREK